MPIFAIKIRIYLQLTIQVIQTIRMNKASYQKMRSWAVIILTFILICNCKKILNVPLDERFTTRIAFLNLAKLTPFDISTLPDSLLPSLKKYSKADDILQWVATGVKDSQIGIISLQSVLYGSLIASRISNQTYDMISHRVDQFVNVIKSNQNIKMYCSSVIMRIPHYNGDFQQPWYWGQYGQQLYTYSYTCSKYNKTKQDSDLQTCKNAESQIPSNIINQFRWRRERNHNITMKLLNILKNDQSLMERWYITLDDSAEYGLNADQAKEVIDFVDRYGLGGRVKVYPGADEVSLTLLAAAAVDDSGQASPIISMIFRNISTINYIPNYQGLPMIQTLQTQIRSAGATPMNGSILKRGNITLLINNFDEDKQLQAPSQSPSNQKKYNIFDNYVCYPNKTQIIGFADNRYSNGADVYFVNYLLGKVKECRNLTQWAYAGWNTNGNTLGTVVANSVLLWVYRSNVGEYAENGKNSQGADSVLSPCQNGNLKCANSYFNVLRILEDKDWQVIMRQLTRNYIYQTPGDNINNLSSDLKFYQSFVGKSIIAKQRQLKQTFNLDFSLKGVYFPWNRTFEIGLYGALDNNFQIIQNIQQTI